MALHVLYVSVALYLTMLLTASLWRSRSWTPGGMWWSLGPRDKADEAPELAARADRAAKNMGESLPMFAIVVLGAYATDKQGPLVDQAALVYLAARVLYLPAYVSGVPVVRTVIWGVGVGATAFIGWVAW